MLALGKRAVTALRFDGSYESAQAIVAALHRAKLVGTVLEPHLVIPDGWGVTEVCAGQWVTGDTGSRDYRVWNDAEFHALHDLLDDSRTPA